jgi:tellurite resistance protein TehA-like permease
MGTGIVSIALALDHEKTLSAILLAIGAAIWLALAAGLGLRLLRDPRQVCDDARAPAALTGVAATAVLGARVVGLGWDWVGAVLLAIALCLWIALIGRVLRHWSTPTVGVAFMTAVATESLSVLAATLAVGERAAWLLTAGVVTFVLGLVLYVFVLGRFDFRQLLTGCGDHWITGGALAIATLAITRITLATHPLHQLRTLVPALKTVSLVLWSVSAAWLVALLVVEVVRRRLDYDVRRWATVFPVGMYAACSFDTGAVARAPAITDFARVWVWVALAVWGAVFVAMAGRARGLATPSDP